MSPGLRSQTSTINTKSQSTSICSKFAFHRGFLVSYPMYLCTTKSLGLVELQGGPKSSRKNNSFKKLSIHICFQPTLRISCVTVQSRLWHRERINPVTESHPLLRLRRPIRTSSIRFCGTSSSTAADFFSSGVQHEAYTLRRRRPSVMLNLYITPQVWKKRPKAA
jgi:hypothetical protein